MKIQDQVITLAQAKKLKGLGVIQKGYFQWQETTNSEPYINHTVFGESTNENEYAAFTVAELGVMLPFAYNTFNDLQGHKQVFTTWHYNGSEDSPRACLDAKHFQTEAEARAEVLIQLLESKEITASEVNIRLQS